MPYSLSDYRTSLRVKDMPDNLRPREYIAQHGPARATDDALLAVLLQGGVKGLNVCDLARRILSDHKSLTALAKATESDLRKYPGIGRVKAQKVMVVFELARRLADEAVPAGDYIRTPADVANKLRAEVRALEHEVFWVLPLNTKNRLKTEPIRISEGLLDGSLVHSREVFVHAISALSAAVVLAHNHPSGDPTPSAEDIRVTRSLVEAGKVIDIRVLDHVILGAAGRAGGEFFSMRESGTLDFG